MGSTKTHANRHISRGKFRKHKPPTRWKSHSNTSPASRPSQARLLNSTGSRIINSQHLASHISEVSQHVATCQQCSSIADSSGEVITLVGEQYHNGLASVLTARCNGCGTTIQFSTSSKVTTPSGGRYWECNLSAVWGQMATGGGFTPLQEQMSVLGVPVMTKRAFIHTERAIGEWWWEVLGESMKAAGQEERQLAIQKGSYHQDVPAIAVIVDGGWSKRTHKHSYNAKSGVAVIIGKATGKLLFLGVRNKYCATCSRASKKGEEPQQHSCFKNWDGSSSSMETDIILEGFRKAEKQHGVRYTKVIGDGDSSVYPTLVAGVPGWGYAITKLECANHATKCYRAALAKLAQDNASYRGKGKLTEAMQKRLSKAARCAITMRSRDTDRKRAIQLLQHDLKNGPLHCFGIHTHCSTYFCKVAQSRAGDTAHSNDNTPPSPRSLQNQPSTGHTDVDIIAHEQEQAWRDAVDDTDLEAIRFVPASDCRVDERMICDVQALVGRLVAKAEQLLGKFLLNAGCISAPSLMVGSRLTAVRVALGRHDVQELAYGTTKDQPGGQQLGSR